MYKDHEMLENIGGKMVLWKFMDLPKFINLLNGKMYFNRLNNFEDVYEGTYPKYNELYRNKIYSGDVKIPEKAYKDIMEYAQNHMYVSCFHNSQSETAFMWKLYGSNDGVAIKTTGKRLKDAFINSKENIYISKVNYIDYNREFLPEGNIMYLGTHKRKSFNSEKEVRCIWNANNKHEACKGVLIDVDLERLISMVYISPYAPEYMTKDVEKILTDRAINAKVIKSNLYRLQ